jgi:agmatinase
LAARRIEFGVVQVDAHADLRDTYEGTPYSHACVMRRVVELDIPIFQIGVRNLCQEEVAFRSSRHISCLDAREIDRDGMPDPLLPSDFPRNVYLTFDVDGFDAALMPATGTPEPGGLSWWQAITVIEQVVAEGRRILGVDVVELAPLANMRAPDYVAAKLTYALMGFAHRSWSGFL